MQNLIKKLSQTSDEEKRILAGDEIDKRVYTLGEDFIINESRLGDTRRGISVRTHTRYVDFPPHSHNFVEMMIVLSGEVRHSIGNEEIVLREGEILLLNKHISHSIKRAGEFDIGVNVIMSDSFIESVRPDLEGTVFSPLLKENAKSDGEGMYLHFGSGEKKITNLIENLLIELTDEGEEWFLMSRSVALLLYYLSSGSERLMIGGNIESGKSSRRTMEIQAYIRNNYRLGTLSDLSEKMYLSAPYLSKLIKQYFGKTFKEMQIDERINRALELIKTTNMPIGDVIRNVGYENESHFHREFSKKTGETPLKIRKRKKREIIS